ncbi:unnamed protein product [Meloidogyne enterolobii]|uniref:Uncharacterized protein n=1 Tax=Meloidogyne enterolobii TaxID=390850 RepID=A0ACB1AW27_MELEN
MLYYKLTFILLLQLLISISAESSDSNNDGSCPKEKIFDSNAKEGVIKSPGYSTEGSDLLDCKWNILPSENTFIHFEFERFNYYFGLAENEFESLYIYLTRWNGSELIKEKPESISVENILSVQIAEIWSESEINSGIFIHFVTNSTHNHSEFEIRFIRKFGDNTYQPCPQPFYFASNSPQYLPILPLKYKQTCLFSINSTQPIKLKINRDNKTKFGVKVFENGSSSDLNEKDQKGQLLANIEGASSPFQSSKFPLIITSRKSVSVIISSSDQEHSKVPYTIEYVAVEPCQCFPNNLTVTRDQPLNLLSQGFPSGYCGSLNCLTQISLENPLNTSDYVESIQIQLNSFQTDSNTEPLSLQIPVGDLNKELIS